MIQWLQAILYQPDRRQVKVRKVSEVRLLLSLQVGTRKNNGYEYWKRNYKDRKST